MPREPLFTQKIKPLLFLYGSIPFASQYLYFVHRLEALIRLTKSPMPRADLVGYLAGPTERIVKKADFVASDATEYTTALSTKKKIAGMTARETDVNSKF